MTPLRCICVLLVIAALWQAVDQWRLRPLHPADGVLAAADPLQTEVTAASPIPHGRWKLTPRATYDITARVLSRENYRFDAMASLVPEDLALGWGPMSDNRILKDIEIGQSYRFYYVRPRTTLPIAREEVISHSANTHVIPADAGVRNLLAQVRVGQVVHLRGLLVDGLREDGAGVRTSLSRTDTGAGACEIMLVQEVSPP